MPSISNGVTNAHRSWTGDDDKGVLDDVDHAVVSDPEPHSSRWMPP